MAKLSDLEFLRLSKGRKFLYRIGQFFASIPRGIANIFVKLWEFLKNCLLAIGREAKDIVTTFIQGDWKTKVSYLVMGFGCLPAARSCGGCCSFCSRLSLSVI